MKQTSLGAAARCFAFFKREPVLVIASAAAVASCFATPPDRAYLDYVDFRTLALLYALMVVVAGLRRAGLFAHLAHALSARAGSVRAMGTVLVAMSFFSAMLITNDVALLTFVPFAVAVLGAKEHGKALIRVVALQTAAANLGSMLTPVGNPQNLYLYSRYGYTMSGFLRLTAPLWACSLVLCLAACLLLPQTELTAFLGEEPGLNRKGMWLHLVLFAVCLLVVLRLISWPVMLLIVLVSLLVLDRKALGSADFLLLLTFVAFFIFSGNLARMEQVDRLLRRLLQGREYLCAVLTSQVISNVPAALLLSGFTENGGALVLGVDIGGLGTPIASLASLISLKLYSHTQYARTGKYLLEFTGWNLLFLLLLSLLRLL